jgi:hypothetical protein
MIKFVRTCVGAPCVYVTHVVGTDAIQLRAQLRRVLTPNEVCATTKCNRTHAGVEQRRAASSKFRMELAQVAW